jgi:hypothetical protein
MDDGGESDRLKDGVVMSPDPALKRLEGLLQPMFLIRLDLILQG